MPSFCSYTNLPLPLGVDIKATYCKHLVLADPATVEFGICCTCSRYDTVLHQGLLLPFVSKTHPSVSSLAGSRRQALVPAGCRVAVEAQEPRRRTWCIEQEDGRHLARRLGWSREGVGVPTGTHPEAQKGREWLPETEVSSGTQELEALLLQ